MVHKKFRHDMKRGLGSCILTLKSCTDIEEYREDVIWGIKNALAYDAQCEGTRAVYFYDMITMFSDLSELYGIVAAGAKRNLKDRGWRFAHYTEILTLMAADGFAAAQQALDELYDMLLKAIRSARRTNIGLFPAVENYSYYCVCVITNALKTQNEKEAFFIRVLSDYGKLIECKPSESAQFEDAWLEYTAQELFGEERTQELLEQAGSDPDIARYIHNKAQLTAERESFQSQRRKIEETMTAEQLYEQLQAKKEIPQLILRRMLRQGKGEEIAEIGNRYAREADENLRKAVLRLFRTDEEIGMLSEDAVSQLVSDMQSENESLREEALRAAADVRNDKLREYAQNRLKLNLKDTDALYMLINNFRAGDGEQMISLVKAVSLNEYNGDWHGVFSAVRNLIEKNTAADGEMSEKLLPYMLREGYCSQCRLDYLEMMQKRGLLTQELIEECQWDCSLGIRELAINAR